MNVPSISTTTTEFPIPDNSAGDSDSDASDEIHDFYQPLSSSYDAEEETLATSDSNPNINGYHTIHPNGSLSNGHDYQAAASENGIRNLDLSQDQDTERRHEEVEEEQEEEARRRVEAMQRALEEDESRRNAPLTSENATRVMEAMRGVSFSGLAPDWASHLSEDHLLDRLRSLRPPPPPSAA